MQCYYVLSVNYNGKVKKRTDGTNSRPASGPTIRENNGSYVFWQYSLLFIDADFIVGTAYMVQQYIFAAFS